MKRRTWLGAWLSVFGLFLFGAGALAQEAPWYEGAEGIEAGLFGSLHRGDAEGFQALLVTGVASIDAPAAPDSFGKVRAWLDSRKVDLSKTKLLRSGPTGLDLLYVRSARSARMVWDLKHRDVRFFLGCDVTYLTSGEPGTARVAGPLRCWVPAQGVRVTPGKGETLGSHEVRRYVVEGQSAGEIGILIRRNGEENRANLPVPRGSWKLALSVVECPGKGSFVAPAPRFELTVADKNSSSTTMLDVTLPEHTESEVCTAFKEGLTGPLDFIPFLRRTYFKVPEGAETSPASVVFTLEIGVEFKPE